MGANVQVCWEKFCRYWRIEPRKVPLEPGRLHLSGLEAAAHCDENTIGVVAILGSTFDGSYEPVAEIGSELDSLAEGGGPDISIHVDAASGGFIAPFLHPDLAWDFRVPRVASINASGHKYGFSRDLADVFLADLRRDSRALAAHPQAHTPLAPEPFRQGFAH
jgi:glutamate decarboxylase